MSDGKCRRCQQPIRWGVTEANGRPIPVNPTPDPNGIMWIVRWETNSTPVFAVASNDRPVPNTEPFRYTAHFATCADTKGKS